MEKMHGDKLLNLSFVQHKHGKLPSINLYSRLKKNRNIDVYTPITVGF